MRRLIAVVGLLIVVSGCSELGFQVDTPAPPSGIRGTVVLGPTCPAAEASPDAQVAVPCLTPYAASLVVLDSESKVVARVTSGSDGTFEVTLVPGDYVVAPATSDSYPIAQPVSVQVNAGQYAPVQINYDTGIR
jgi:hypothetical protein